MGEAKRKAKLREALRVNRKIPENLDLALEHEQEIVRLSRSAISVDMELLDHVELLEAVLDYQQFHAAEIPSADIDIETVQLLGARSFNSMLSAHGLMLRGYYQISASLIRDVIETAFLLDYFGRDRLKIREWRESDHRTRMKIFGPGAVRKFLDDHHGFKGKKRGEVYHFSASMQHTRPIRASCSWGLRVGDRPSVLSSTNPF